jgi:hypothetical protein
LVVHGVYSVLFLGAQLALMLFSFTIFFQRASSDFT